MDASAPPSRTAATQAGKPRRAADERADGGRGDAQPGARRRKALHTLNLNMNESTSNSEVCPLEHSAVKKLKVMHEDESKSSPELRRARRLVWQSVVPLSADRARACCRHGTDDSHAILDAINNMAEARKRLRTEPAGDDDADSDTWSDAGGYDSWTSSCCGGGYDCCCGILSSSDDDEEPLPPPQQQQQQQQPVAEQIPIKSATCSWRKPTCMPSIGSLRGM